MNTHDDWRLDWEVIEVDETSDEPASALNRRWGLGFIYVYADVGPGGAFQWCMFSSDATREREQQLRAEMGHSFGAFHGQLYKQGLQLWHELGHKDDGTKANPGLLQ